MVNDNSSSKSELRRLLNRYTEVVKDHIRAKEAYKTQVRESMVRTAQLLGVSDKELLAHPEGFMRSAIMDSMATGEAESVYSATLQRERDVQNLEHSVVELCGLFNDVAMLIDQQALDLNTISANIQSANTHVERGKTQIQEATRYQVRHRYVRAYVSCPHQTSFPTRGLMEQKANDVLSMHRSDGYYGHNCHSNCFTHDELGISKYEYLFKSLQTNIMMREQNHLCGSLFLFTNNKQVS